MTINQEIRLRQITETLVERVHPEKIILLATDGFAKRKSGCEIYIRFSV